MLARWVTERTRSSREPLPASDRALAESIERYRSLFDYNPHAAFSLDLGGTFTDANAVAQRLSGYSLEELCEMGFNEVICTEHRSRTLAAFAGAVGRVPQQLEANMWHRDGHVIELSLTAIPVIVDNEVVGVHGVAEDVTERNEMRRELERNRVIAQEASAAKSVFLANMSHEVRTPLTSLLGAAELLLDGDLPPAQGAFVEMINRSGQRLLRLVNDILDFSRIEAGTVELRREALCLRGLVAEAVEWAVPVARQEGLDFTWQVDPTLPEKLSGDALRISQVLTNLLGNSFKFTEEGHVRLVVDMPRRGPDWVDVRFQVEDTGIGIPAGNLTALFRSFTQVDPSTTRKYGGAGPGLAISRELVTLMGGSIRADSTPGAGSMFSFTLPLEIL